MSDLLSTSVSGLLAFQRSLDTTSHNIANVATDGYSRQRAEIVTRTAQPYSNGWLGSGADVSTVQRSYDQFLAVQSRSTSSSLERLNILSSQTGQLNSLFSDSASGLSATLQTFQNALQGLANDPTSIPARQVVLSSANSLKDRIQFFNDRLDGLDQDSNSRITDEAQSINTLGQQIAQLNGNIVSGLARTGQPPNDLLDQRDRLIDQLATHVSVSTTSQPDGSINVSIGSGQSFVLGSTAANLITVKDSFDPTRLGIAIKSTNTVTDITRALNGGSLGGVLDFRRDVLDDAHNSLGRLAIALTDVANTQHGKGIDLAGNLGTNLFSVGGADVLGNSANTGTAAIAVAVQSSSALTTQNYFLKSTLGGWQLTRADTGATVPMSGAGTALSPFVADGLSFVVSGTPTVGDQFLIRPTRSAASGFDVQITDPAKIAAAAPIKTAANAANTSAATISSGSVLDASNAQLRTTATIQFVTTSTYSVNGGAPIAYVSGQNIDVNGWRVQISGTPAIGDSFTVSDNAGGSGDNRNALALADVLNQPVLDGGTSSLHADAGRIVSGIGVVTQQAQANRDAQQTIHNDDIAARDSVSGVNLDEEAANMLKYQQAYQAAAQMIKVADTLFQSILSAIAR